MTRDRRRSGKKQGPGAGQRGRAERGTSGGRRGRSADEGRPSRPGRGPGVNRSADGGSRGHSGRGPGGRGQGSYVYGRHPVEEILRRSPQDIEKLFVLSAQSSTLLSDIVRGAEEEGVPVVTLAKKMIQELVGEVNHQGLVAKVKPFRYVEMEEILERAKYREETPLVVVLDQIQDPHNLGAIIRSAYALGAHGVVIPKDRACEVTPTAVKSSAGATAHTPVAQVINLRRALDELREAGLWIVGTHLDGDRTVDQVDFTAPTALVIGSEGKGLRRLTAESCDVLAAIPMATAQGVAVGSLNASVAAGVCLYEALRQRQAI